MPLLRRLWWAGGGRDPISVPGALRRAEERRREGRYAEAGGGVARAPARGPDKLPPPLLPACPPPPRHSPAHPRVDRLHLPGTGRALIIARADGGLIASQPVAEDAKDVAEALAHMLHLATGALERAGLGPLHRAIVDDGHDAVFTRTDGGLVVSLALPRATDPTQGLLDVNRLWSATLHELGLAGTPAIAPPATPVNTPVASDSTGAPHAPQARARAR